MRIALRTGGGRGVYELAGSQGEYTASDIFNKELYYEITPNLIIPGRARADKRQGKPRIKLDEQETTTHLYRLIASLLLLPKPKREFKTTGGDTLISFESYSITVIKIDISSVMPDKVIIRPTDILLASYSGLEQHVDFIERLSRIIEIWKAVEKIDSELATLLRNHKKSFYANDVNFKIVEKSARAIANHLEIIYDPLEKIEALTEVEQNNSHKETSRIILGKSFGLEDDQSPQLARIETVKQWRKVAVRGGNASKFRQNIRASYRETCMFTGQKLPKMKWVWLF
ncbi:MAG: hypothetical protein Q3M30_18815 [Candidatus Electrothrix sp. Rat3]|nr:hypothetical protein [Candidatus Electrothrix rattekaaiensis]